MDGCELAVVLQQDKCLQAAIQTVQLVVEVLLPGGSQVGEPLAPLAQKELVGAHGQHGSWPWAETQVLVPKDVLQVVCRVQLAARRQDDWAPAGDLEVLAAIAALA